MNAPSNALAQPSASAPTGERRKRWPRWLTVVIVCALGVVVIGATLLVTVLPEYAAQLQTEQVRGNERIAIGDPAIADVSTADVGQAALWSASPLVTPLIDGIGVLKHPGVLFGHAPGARLVSPDGKLEMTFEPARRAQALEQLETAADEAGGTGGATVLKETLASGLEVRHVTTAESQFVAVVELGVVELGVVELGDATSSVLVRAELLDQSASLDDYRATIGALLESIVATP